MPEQAFVYGLPYVLYKRYGIRRYGFHGTSHFYVSRRAAEFLKRPIEQLCMITCHLGNGCSMAAVRYGVSIDTTMGYTPVEGLLMGTRCGDLDPSAVLYIMGREELSQDETNAMLNKHSGMMGISGVSSDMREIIQEMNSGNKRAKLAFDVFCYRIKKYVGAYAASMGSLDAIVFTGGIGENAAPVRAASLAGLEFLGVEVDAGLNNHPGSEERLISKAGSRVAALVIPTNEELVIALDTDHLVSQRSRVD
jgi:acetate kinase